jgi:hypothetical protein
MLTYANRYVLTTTDRYAFPGACKTGMFCPKPPGTDSRRPGKRVTIHRNDDRNNK